jgi:hypothetical protein
LLLLLLLLLLLRRVYATRSVSVWPRQTETEPGVNDS